MITDEQIRPIVAELEQARVSRRAMRLPSALVPGLDRDGAYAIQHRWAEERVAQGRRRIGYKVALTTPGSQRSFGLDRPSYGILLDDMRFAEGSTIPHDRFIGPRVEIELAFVMRSELRGRRTREEALAAVDWVSPAAEIIDNRVMLRDPESGGGRTGLDLAADGGAAAGVILADRRYDPARVDLARQWGVLRHNGDVEDSGVFATIFGAPEQALVELATQLDERGEAIAPGDIVLCGSVIKPFPAAAGDRFEFDFGELGKLSFAFA